MIALDSSPDPPLEQVHLSYKDWVQATPLPRERLRIPLYLRCYSRLAGIAGMGCYGHGERYPGGRRYRQSTCREGGNDRQELRCLGDFLAILGDTSTARSVFLQHYFSAIKTAIAKLFGF